jgi:hypothetical protein
MNARILQFPKRPLRERLHVRVERDRDGGDWLVIFDGQAWPHFSRAAAMADADEIAVTVGANIVAAAPR